MNEISNAATGSKGRKSAIDVKDKSAEIFDAATGSGGRKSAYDILDITDSGIDYNSEYDDDKAKVKNSKKRTLLYIGGTVLLGFIGLIALKKKKKRKK